MTHEYSRPLTRNELLHLKKTSAYHSKRNGIKALTILLYIACTLLAAIVTLSFVFDNEFLVIPFLMFVGLLIWAVSNTVVLKRSGGKETAPPDAVLLKGLLKKVESAEYGFEFRIGANLVVFPHYWIKYLPLNKEVEGWCSKDAGGEWNALSLNERFSMDTDIRNGIQKTRKPGPPLLLTIFSLIISILPLFLLLELSHQVARPLLFRWSMIAALGVFPGCLIWTIVVLVRNKSIIKKISENFRSSES